MDKAASRIRLRFAMQKGLPCIPKVVLLESKEALNDQKCDE